MSPDFLPIEGGDIYGPEPRGKGSVLVAAGRILATGAVDASGLRAFEVESLDASGCVVVPGFLDRH